MRPRLGVVCALALLGCARAPDAPETTVWNAPREGVRGVSSGTRAERYFPLVDGHIYQYATRTERGEAGMLIARVHRSGPRQGELRFPSGVRRFAFTGDGIARADSGAYVLKEPLELGATWVGEHGGRARIVAIGAQVEVPAGRFAGCVRVVEERLGDRPAQYTSTFCPDVGLVVLEAAGGGSYERAELKSYAPPFDIGPDGVQRTPVDAPPPPAAPAPP